VFEQASFQSPPAARIRQAIWSKLLTNMSLSVLCLITGQTAKASGRTPRCAMSLPRLLEEAQTVGQSCCPDIGASPQRTGARSQAFDPAGLRIWSPDGNRHAGQSAGRVCQGCGTIYPDARLLAGLPFSTDVEPLSRA